MPVEKRFTKTYDVFRFDMLRGSTLLTDAGLLGPVNITQQKEQYIFIPKERKGNGPFG